MPGLRLEPSGTAALRAAGSAGAATKGVPLPGSEKRTAGGEITAGTRTAPTAPVTPAPPEQGTELADVMLLVGAAQAGDSDAFGRLYDRYVDLVYRYVYYRVGGQPLAEDLTSETFLRALRRIANFTWQGKDFGAWLVTIARNLIADHFKSGRFRLEVVTADMLDSDQGLDGPEGRVVESLVHAALLKAVRQLGSEQQECVVLRFLQGLSVAETALIMGKNEGAIKALQYRAVRALAKLLPPDLR